MENISITTHSTTDAVTARDFYFLLPAAPVNSDVGFSTLTTFHKNAHEPDHNRKS